MCSLKFNEVSLVSRSSILLENNINVNNLAMKLPRGSGFDLILRKTVMKTFATNISFRDFMVDLAGRTFLLQIFQNHWATYFP